MPNNSTKEADTRYFTHIECGIDNSIIFKLECWTHVKNRVFR